MKPESATPPPNGAFPETSNTGNAQDLFGNVYEWAQDSRQRKRSKANPAIEHKIVLGGSFITHLKHLWPHHPLTFMPIYCISFLGFRILCEK
jgi:formylglycine-generating enzyme required for sulfatase activity